MGRPVRRPIWCVLPCDHYPCLLLFSNLYIYIYIFLKEGVAFSDGGRKVGWEQVIFVSLVSTVHGVCTLSTVLCKPEEYIKLHEGYKPHVL